MTIDLILSRLKGATNSKDIFGDLRGTKDEMLDEIKSIFNQMAKLVHPDKAPGDKVAEEAFKLLTNFVDRAREEVERDEYGKEKPIIVSSKKNKYSIIGKPISGDIANIYNTKENCVLKVSKELNLNKFLDKEAENLKKIHKQSDPKKQALAWLKLIFPV
jgi:hypothetical protein